MKLFEPDLFIFVGEPSGDLHGEKLIMKLLGKCPTLKICGVGGPRMRAAGLDCLMPMERFQVMGFIDVFLVLPKLIRQFYFLGNKILSLNPKTVLFIDYPGFNLRMANYLRKKGFKGKLCHYICPSVWAWGKKRIPLMASTLDRLFSILPFEAKYFAQTSLKTSYVGHPLVERLAEHVYKPFSYPQNKKLIAIFPGSRKKEIFKNFPRQVRVAKRLLDKDPDLIFGISISQNDFIPYLQKEIEKEGLSIEKHFKLVFSDSTYELMKSAMLAIAKSGTVTLELALHEVPTVVVYGVTKLDTFIAINLLKIRLPFYCIANIICEEEVFPELIGPNFTEDQLYFHIQRFLSTPHLQEQCKEKCQKLRHILQEKNASQCIAEELDLLRN